jgi:hypothetical protein
LKSANGEEQAGSSSYVPQEKAKDTQLQGAIDLLHRKKSGCSQNEWIRLGAIHLPKPFRLHPLIQIKT